MNLLSSFLVSTALAADPVDLAPVVEPSVLDLTVRPELEAAMLQMLTVETVLFAQSCNLKASGHGVSPFHSFAFSEKSAGRLHAELTSANPANHTYLGFRDTAKNHRCLGWMLADNPQFIGEAGGYDYVCEPNLMGARVTDPGFIFPKTTRVLLPYLSCEFTPVVGEI